MVYFDLFVHDTRFTALPQKNIQSFNTKIKIIQICPNAQTSARAEKVYK
jgi:hypothetical protein